MANKEQISFSKGNDECDQFTRGDWGWYPGYKDYSFEYTFGEVAEKSLLIPLLEVLNKQGRELRTLEIGANTGVAMSDVMNFLAQQVPPHMPVHMDFVDCNPYRSDEIQFPLHISDNFSLRYFAQTEAGSFLSQASQPYSIIYGYAVEFLVERNCLRKKEPLFVEQLRQHIDQVLLPGGLLLFAPGRPLTSPDEEIVPPLLPEEDFENFDRLGAITILRKKIK